MNSELAIDRNEIIGKMPDYVRQATCNCERQEYMFQKMVDEFKKKLEKHCQNYGFPREVHFIR